MTGFLPQAGAVVLPQFGAATNFPAEGGPYSVIVADFNRDGKADVAVAGDNGVRVLLGLGDGTFAPSTNYALSGAVHLAAGDFNNDGNLDLAIANGYDIKMLLGDGKGNFLPGTGLYDLFSFPTGLAVGDFNGDGKPDIAVPDSGQSVIVAFGQGNGSFGPHTNYTVAGNDIRAGDLHGNGRLDLVVSLGNSSNSLCVLSNRGDGTFAAPQYYAAGSNGEHHYSLELGDFNADGKLDVAVLNYNAKSVTVWLNSGSGILTPAHEYTLGFSPTCLAGGDFNGDGKMDLIVRGGTAARVLAGNGDGSFIVGAQMSVPDDAENIDANSGVAVGDFNGRPGLAFVNYPDSSVAIMLNQTPPTLEITPMAGYNQISWLAAFGAGFTLECTTNLSVPGSWQPFPYPPVLIGNQTAVTDWETLEQKFYRLRKP